jgi:hypothetical protein
MTAAALLADLRGRGIQLAVAGDRLRFRPQSAMTAELAGRIKASKAELLTLLSVDPGRLIECCRLVAEMFERVCHAMPMGCVLSEADWKRLDVVHERIDDARRRGDLADLGLAVGCYESLAAEIFQRRISYSGPVCRVHQQQRWWRSTYGDHLACGRHCHPVATPNVFAEWALDF